MNDLLRELAPISNRAWTEVEAEAKLMLAARKLVDFSGPLGWAISATSLGRTRALKATFRVLSPEAAVPLSYAKR